MTIHFTSDLHLGHRAVFTMRSRSFPNVEAMNAQLIKNINERVGVNDTLWILGDVSYRIGRDAAENLLRQIRCRNLRLVRGNHDRDWSDKGLFAEICDYKELNLDGRRVCLMHYPIASWNGMHRGSVHLHGHSHNAPGYNLANVADGHLLWDVGVDANGYAPISWEYIRDSLLRLPQVRCGRRAGHHGRP